MLDTSVTCPTNEAQHTDCNTTKKMSLFESLEQRILKNIQYKLENTYDASYVSKLKDIENKLEGLFIKLESIGTINANGKPKVNIGQNIDKLHEEYIAHRKTFTEISLSSIKSYNAAIAYLKYFCTENTVFDFSFFKDIQNKLLKIPKNFFKYQRYYKQSYQSVMRLAKTEQFDTLDHKTINNHMSCYKQFFDYLRYEEIIQENPLIGIKPLPEKQGTTREEYTKKDLEKIFTSDMTSEFLNMCKVSLYTGLRIEEILSLKKENIQDKLIYVDLKDSSTKKHQRIIPIHQNLMSAINYQIKHNVSEYLFSHGNNPNNVKNIGKKVNRKLKDIIPSNTKTFHSLRKNFSQNIELNSDSEDKIKKYLMGHSQNKDITHSIYNRGKINIDKLIKCVESIDFQF